MADFLNALGAPNRRLAAVAWAADKRAVLDLATAGELPAGGGARPVSDLFTGMVSDITGKVVTTAVQANLRSAERQQELDRRIMPGIPSSLQAVYLALMVLGLFGVPLSRLWWQTDLAARDCRRVRRPGRLSGGVGGARPRLLAGIPAADCRDRCALAFARADSGWRHDAGALVAPADRAQKGRGARRRRWIAGGPRPSAGARGWSAGGARRQGARLARTGGGGAAPGQYAPEPLMPERVQGTLGSRNWAQETRAASRGQREERDDRWQRSRVRRFSSPAPVAASASPSPCGRHATAPTSPLPPRRPSRIPSWKAPSTRRPRRSRRPAARRCRWCATSASRSRWRRPSSRPPRRSAASTSASTTPAPSR